MHYPIIEAGIDAHLRKLRLRDDISAEEEATIRAAIGPAELVPAETVLVRPGEELTFSTLLLDGFLCRFKDLHGGQRQITELHVPGDFADLHSFTLRYLDHSLMTLTPCRIARMPHTALHEITERYAHLSRVYWFLTNLDACLHREWEVSLGRRSAIQRAAHLFCELKTRLEGVGRASDAGFAFPVTQAVLAECLGLTPVHVNRVLKELRERRVIEFRAGQVTIHDWPGLQSIAEFDPAYLYLQKRAR